MKKTRKVLEAPLDKVIIKPIQESERMVGGLIASDYGNETPEFGEIIKVGPGVMNVFGHFIPNQSKIGEIVAIPRIGSFKFSYQGEDYFITREQELLAKIKDEEYEEE